MNIRHIAVSLALLVTVAGCAINQSVRPVTSNEIREVCIKRNPEVMMGEFATTLKNQVEARGIKASLYDGATPAECRFRIEYSANWRWDLAMYLVFAQVRVFDRELLVGEANYDARGGGANMSKFGKTENKLQGLVDELFPKR